MADDQPLDEYNDALDHVAGVDDGPEEVEVDDVVKDTATAIGITEAPSAKAQGLLDQHPEIWPDYEETVLDKLVIRDAYPPTKDASHTSYPFLTLYERTKVLSMRASQLEHGAQPLLEYG